jgi:galactonate dehydratase
MLSRRGLLAASLPGALMAAARPRPKVTRLELIPVRATARTVWMNVRLQASDGSSGLGEASDAFGFANTTKAEAQRMERELASLFSIVEGRSPFEIERFRQQAWPRVEREGLVVATAFSAIEQALWDLAGQAAGMAIHQFFGGAVRQELPAYANINRRVSPRNPAGFAEAARAAVAAGFRHVKLAPFDGFPPATAPQADRDRAVEQGIAAVVAVRQAVGAGVGVMIDCHSFFSVPLAIEVARRLEPENLGWYEEPVPPGRTEETLAIRKAIRQPMAGGEILFGLRGFADLVERRAVDVIMPDVKHCGGLLELTRIAVVAAAHGVDVSPHNPSGPVATVASAHVCATVAGFRLLEIQWGEVPWRAELITPVENLTGGVVRVASVPGLGVKLNERLARRYSL